MEEILCFFVKFLILSLISRIVLALSMREHSGKALRIGRRHVRMATDVPR